MRQARLLLALAALFLFPAGIATAEDNSAHYYIPNGQLNGSLQIMDLGFANVMGLFRSATGSFEFDDAGKNISNLRIAIDAGSLITGNSENDSDLAAMIGVAQYPEIRFTALPATTFKDGKADIAGTLTVHGVSKPVTFSATLNRQGKSPKGGGMWDSEGDAIGLSLHGSFKRADFGMTDNPEMPGRFGDTVTLQLEAQALKQ